MKYATTLSALALAATLQLHPALAAAAGPAACQSGPAAEQAIVQTVAGMFAAVRTDDLAAFQKVVAADFYTYDGGARFTTESLMGLIKKVHAGGVQFEWNVTAPLVHIACTSAWVTYVNQGARISGAVRQPVTWLESANLDYHAGHWQVDFLHSTPVAPAP